MSILEDYPLNMEVFKDGHKRQFLKHYHALIYFFKDLKVLLPDIENSIFVIDLRENLL